MTKLDGTAKGGILVAIADRFKIPIIAIGVGESRNTFLFFWVGETNKIKKISGET